MRRRPNSRDNKALSVIKSQLSVIDGAKTSSITTRKPGKIPWSRRAKHQNRIKYCTTQPRRANLIASKQIKSAARVMADLHIPFLDKMSAKIVRLDESWFQQMRWSYWRGVTTHETQLIWEKPGYMSQDEQLIPCYESDSGPHWNLPPTRPPDEAIFHYTTHLERNSLSDEQSDLQIPASWHVFDAVNWEQKFLFQVALTDSSENKREENLPYVYSDDSEYNSHTLETVVHFRAQTVIQLRKRRQYELLKAMHPKTFRWRYQTDKRARRRDANRHAGYLDCNQASQNQDLWPQTALTALLGPQNPYPGYPSEHPEVSDTNAVGRLIINSIATDEFPAQSREILEWPAAFAYRPYVPIIDYTCRSRDFSFGLHQKFYPLLYAAQYDRGDIRLAIRQLAMAFQPMMMLFILYYLDTRASRDEPMPPWMFLCGTVYNRDGLHIRAFHPVFRPPAQTQRGLVADWGWGATVTDFYAMGCKVLNDDPPERAQTLVALNRVQGHCRQVLGHLSRWGGYERVLDRLSTYKQGL